MKKNWFKIYIAAIAALLVVGCQSEPEAVIYGQFAGSDAKMYLEVVATDGAHLIDSVALDGEGRYKFVIKGTTEAPSLYNVVYGGSRIPLLVANGESVELNATGDVLADYTVSGSSESELLGKFHKEYVGGKTALEAILKAYQSANKSTKKELEKQYNASYKEIKRKQISFIVEHKESLAAIYALYQRLQGDQYLSGSESGDLIHFRAVEESVSQKYPSASLVAILRKDIANIEARIALLNSVEVCSYPELNGPNMYGEKVSLSSLDGNVILVDFWSAEAGNSNLVNLELKELYEKYESKGFRIYQVSADTSKLAWVTTVQELHLPWISVCDFRGEASPMIKAYNVRKLPSNFLIDRKGNIVAKDLYGKSLEQMLAKILK